MSSDWVIFELSNNLSEKIPLFWNFDQFLNSNRRCPAKRLNLFGLKLDNRCRIHDYEKDLCNLSVVVKRAYF